MASVARKRRSAPGAPLALEVQSKRADGELKGAIQFRVTDGAGYWLMSGFARPEAIRMLQRWQARRLKSPRRKYPITRRKGEEL